MSIQTNAADIVTVSVMGQVANPSLSGLPAEPYRLDADGRAFLWPTFGGIVYNVSVGDSAFGWAGDCIHPLRLHRAQGRQQEPGAERLRLRRQ